MYEIEDAQLMLYKKEFLANPSRVLHEAQNKLIDPELIQVELQKLFEEDQQQKTVKEIALGFAMAEYNAGAKEIPPGSNRGPWCEKYQEHKSWLKGAHWCGSFVTWCVLQATQKLDRPRLFEQHVGAAVINLFKWGLNKDLCHNANKYDPEPGDIFLILNNTLTRGVHTGFVKEFIKEENKIITIEGNADNRVTSFRRLKADSIKYYLALK